MTMKYTLIGGLCVASILSATAFGAQRSMLNGFYAALTGSVLGFESEASSTGIDMTAPITAFGLTNDYGDNGWGAELAVGYGIRGGVGRSWALDLEVFANLIEADIDLDFAPATTDNVIRSHEIEAEDSWGVRIKPGYFVHRYVKFFVPLAVTETEFEHEYDIHSPSTGPTDYISKHDESATGFEFGFGIEAFLTPRASLAVSATRTVYEEYDIDINTAPGTPADDVNSIEENYENSINRGNVTFIYRFGGRKYHARNNAMQDK